MAVNYCLPIFVDSLEAAKDLVDKYSREYQYFEFWLEYFTDPESTVKYFAPLLKDRAIFLFRRLKLDPPIFPQSYRQHLISLISDHSCYIDFDMTSQKNDLEYYSQKMGKAKLIASYHNYEATPSSHELEALLLAMKGYSPDIYKLACFCETENDAIRLLNARLFCNSAKLPSIILGMGEHGLVTRLFCTLWGNKMIFAPVDRTAQTAPEQLSLEELKQCFDVLDGKVLRHIN